MTADSLDEPSQFTLGAHTRIRTDDGRLLAMGEPGTGMAAIGGPLPLGYYKDDRKTEDTFQVIDGMRYSIPGDYVEYLPDGTVRFLGRGSACINTGGEKVYAEEVELVLKDHRAIRDAACIGVADRRFGELVCAVIATAPGASISREDVAAYVRSRLASYKAPRALVVMPEIPRTVQGKIDYPKVREYALAQLGERVDSAAGR
jgi:fatty-acyl-CoA synthase